MVSLSVKYELDCYLPSTWDLLKSTEEGFIIIQQNNPSTFRCTKQGYIILFLKKKQTRVYICSYIGLTFGRIILNVYLGMLASK